MQINIGIIKINVITNVGSFNVGKTILCNNRALVTVQPGPAEIAEAPAAALPEANPGGPPDDPRQRGEHST
jgi:hypothetical protein